MVSKYWEKHYKYGGNSGTSLMGREWLWEHIIKYSKMDDVIDIGCGDLFFWEGRDCNRYIGIDISPTVINENYNKRPNWRFICDSADIQQNIFSETVISFNFLFHILDDNTFNKILENITFYAKDTILIWTWGKNPFKEKKYRLKILFWLFSKGKFYELFDLSRKEITTDFVYQKYRDFNNYIPVFEKNGFKLLSKEFTDRFPYGELYIFKKFSK